MTEADYKTIYHLYELMRCCGNVSSHAVMTGAALVRGDDKQVERVVTTEECDDMLQQIAGVEAYHGDDASITMTTSEARAFVLKAKEAAWHEVEV